MGTSTYTNFRILKAGYLLVIQLTVELLYDITYCSYSMIQLTVELLYDITYLILNS